MLPIIQIAESTSFLITILIMGIVVQQILVLFAGIWLYRQWEELRRANERADKSTERAHQAHVEMLHSINEYVSRQIESNSEIDRSLSDIHQTLHMMRTGVVGVRTPDIRKGS